jgi:hypothetical protein
MLLFSLPLQRSPEGRHRSCQSPPLTPALANTAAALLGLTSTSNGAKHFKGATEPLTSNPFDFADPSDLQIFLELLLKKSQAGIQLESKLDRSIDQCCNGRGDDAQFPRRVWRDPTSLHHRSCDNVPWVQQGLPAYLAHNSHPTVLCCLQLSTHGKLLQ